MQSYHQAHLCLNQHRRILALSRQLTYNIIRTPRPRRPRPNPLIQTNRHSIHGVDLAIKCRLKVPVRTQTLLNET